MADKTEFLQAIGDAILDADSLERFINGSDSETVLTRLSAEYPTLKKAIKTLFENGGLPATPFETKAAMEASSLADGSYAVVTNDPDISANALYLKGSGSWIRSKYNNLEYLTENVLSSVKSVIPNGYFEEGTNHWSGLSATLSVESGNLVITNRETMPRTSGIASILVNYKREGKYLLRAKVKVTSEKCITVVFGNSGSFKEQYVEYHNPPVNEWIIVEGIVNTLDTAGNLNLSHSYETAEDASGQVMYVEFVEMLDLSVLGEFSSDIEVVKDLLAGDKSPYVISTEGILRHLNSIIESNIKSISSPIYNPGTAETGAISGITGEIVNTHIPSYKYTGFIPVKGATQLKLSGFTSVNHPYAFYDARKQAIEVVNHYIPGTTDPIPDGKWVMNGLIDVPEGAVYFAKTIQTPRPSYDDPGKISIEALGVGSISNTGASNLYGYLPLSEEDSKTSLSSKIFETAESVSGTITESGVVTDLEGSYDYSGLIDISGYDYVKLTGFSSTLLERAWFDKDKNLLEFISSTNENKTKFQVNGTYVIPKTAVYFGMNTRTHEAQETNGIILGERLLNSSDFLKRGEGGDASQGWGNTLNAMQTTKQVEISNPYFPEIKPLKIIHYGKDNSGYPYGERIEFDTEIFRFAWGIQICMNASKPALTNATGIEDFNRANSFNVKTLKAYNGLLAEWGVEGFSWHVSPPGADWGHRAWMNLKVGGHEPRGDAKYPYQIGSTVQFFVPEWTERRDTTNSEVGGWTQSSTNPTRDDEYPTKTMIRESAHFKSPEFYRATHGNTEVAGWDHYVRTRGSVADPTPVENGDCIHKEVFSVGTGAIKAGLPATKEVAMMEVRYKEGDPNYEAEFIFKLKNKITGEWDEVAKH